ncbi:MAG: M23 family metallopeptidase [Nitrospirota bacterium]
MKQKCESKTFAVFSLLLLIFFAFLSSASAASFKVRLSHKNILQGDAFFIRVTGAKTSSPPSAVFEGRELFFTGCGKKCFLAIGAVDIGTDPGVYRIQVKAGKNRKNLKLRVKSASFPEIRLELPDEKVFLSPDDLETVHAEKERLQRVFAVNSEKQWEGEFILPLENDVSTEFGTRRIMNSSWTSVHKGTDIRGQEGEEVMASNNGSIVLAEELFFGGNTVIVDHGLGIYTIYMHLSQMRVKPGDVVAGGDIIGLVGSSGRSTGPHLHFGVKVQGINVNPLSLVELSL